VAITFEIELPLGADQPGFARADLTFYGLDHSGPSYEVRVFFNHRDASPETALNADTGFAGKFSVFGHGGCFGEEGHCEVRAPVSAFDRRPPHQLVPAVRILTVTDAIRDLLQRDARSVTVTAVPVVRPSPLATAEQSADVLVVDQVALHTFE
jgi:tyrosinase